MRAAFPVVLLLALGLLMPAAHASSGSLSGPRLTIGDFWRYRTNTSLGGGFYLAGDVTTRVAELGPEPIGGTTYDTVRMTVTGSGAAVGAFSTRLGSTPATGTWVLTGEEILESGGLKIVKSVLDLEANGTLETRPVPIPFVLSVQNTTTFRFFDDRWRFPLAIGNSSVVVGRMNFTEDFRFSYGFETRVTGQAWWNITYALEASIAIDTPAGRFDAFPIFETAPDGSYMVFYFAPATGNDARTETYNGTTKVATNDLASYRYQALEPTRFLGLTANQWEIVAAVAAVGSSAVAFWWIRTRRRVGPPETGPPPAS